MKCEKNGLHFSKLRQIVLYQSMCEVQAHPEMIESLSVLNSCLPHHQETQWCFHEHIVQHVCLISQALNNAAAASYWEKLILCICSRALLTSPCGKRLHFERNNGAACFIALMDPTSIPTQRRLILKIKMWEEEVEGIWLLVVISRGVMQIIGWPQLGQGWYDMFSFCPH